MRFLPVAVLLLFSSAASAAPILFDNRDAFNAAVGEYQLFTDFPLEKTRDSSYDFAGVFGPLTIRQEGFELNWGETIGPNGLHSDGHFGTSYLGVGVSSPIRAIGFDLVSAGGSTVMSWDPTTGLVSPRLSVPTTFTFGFTTIGGEHLGITASPGSFVGALLYDDAFEWLSLTNQANCFCQSSFAIDNLSVAAVPEPPTAILLGLGLLGIAAARRRRLAATR